MATAAVTNGSSTVTVTGAGNLTTLGILAGDIVTLMNATNSANIKNVKVVSVLSSTTLQVDNSVWVTESGISITITTSYDNASEEQKKYAHLCDEGTGEFGNGDAGFVLL